MQSRATFVAYTLLGILCWLWFLFFLLMALGFVLMRGLADEPGAPMTLPRALVIAALFVAIGSPGFIGGRFAVRALRRIRERRGQMSAGFEVLPPR